MKRIFSKLLVMGIMLCLLGGCHREKNSNVIRVGTIAGPETTLMEVAKKVALKEYGLRIKIITFSDYNVPNVALNDGSIDANVFQHRPYLEQQMATYHYSFAVIGKTFIYPMGLYSKKYSDLGVIPDGSTVAIPNDPTNEARALLLLQKASLIQLKAGATTNATPLDIVSNPKKLRFIELDAAQMPRALQDVAVAAINTNYAISAGLHPESALFHENVDSPYANLIVVRQDEKDDPRLKELVKALNSLPVMTAAQRLFGVGGAIPAW